MARKEIRSPRSSSHTMGRHSQAVRGGRRPGRRVLDRSVSSRGGAAASGRSRGRSILRVAWYDMTTVEIFVEALREHGVEWIATLCGHGLDLIYDAARRAGIRLIDTRNEQTAGYIAEAYGRLTRRPGICAS